MSRLPFSISTEGPRAVPETTADTILRFTAPANHRVIVKAFHVWIEGLNVDETLVTGRLAFQTGGTGGTGVTEHKKDGSHNETVQTSGEYLLTGEGTLTQIVRRFLVGPMGYSYAWPEGDEPVVGGSDIFGVDLVAAAAGITATVEFELEE